MNTIYFDMDGTIADLYGVSNWLDDLRAEKVTPYAQARPLIKMAVFAKLLKKLQKQGYKIGIISWTAKRASQAYTEDIKNAKERWLKKHLPSVTWDEIHIVEYGTPKTLFKKSVYDILFDDEKQNREEWRGIAVDETNILATLKVLTS